MQNLLMVPMRTPVPAPTPERTDASCSLPVVRSTSQVHNPAPRQAPNIVPKIGTGMMNVPATAPTRAPRIAAPAPSQPAPAFLAPPAPAKNSINSAINAKAVIAISNGQLKSRLSHFHHANRQVVMIISQLPGSVNGTSISQHELKEIKMTSQR